MRNRLTAAALIACAGLLSACDNDSNGGPDGPPPAAPVTANTLATQQINTRTCESLKPQSINELTIDDTEAAVDIDSLTPACASGT